MKKEIETRIVAHHVGGRGFGVAFNIPQRFRSDVQHVLYEADPESAESMLSDSSGPMAQAMEKPIVLPYCLGRTKGKSKLNITSNAYASSIYNPDKSFFKYYCDLSIPPAYYDVTYDDMLNVVQRVDVDVHAMDDLFAENKIPAAARPDMLSLDTQGYELEIMKGAEEIIQKDVLAIATEIEILSMYEGQPLFQDILSHLKDKGFVFAGYLDLYEVMENRVPVGLRAKEFPAFGDALFLRRLEDIPKLCSSNLERFVKYRKIAFIAISFGYLSYGLKALGLARRIKLPADSGGTRETRAYDVFLDALEQAARNIEPLFPPIYGVPEENRPKSHPPAPPAWSTLHHNAVVNNFLRLQARDNQSTDTPPPQPVPSVSQAYVNPVWEKIESWTRYVFFQRPRGTSVPLLRLLPRHPIQFAGKFGYRCMSGLGIDRRIEAALFEPGLFSRNQTISKISAWLYDTFIQKPRYSKERLGSLLPHHPIRFFGKLVYYLLVGLYLVRHRTVAVVNPSQPTAAGATDAEAGNSEVETLLHEFGFATVADILRNKRIPRERFLRTIPDELREKPAV